MNTWKEHHGKFIPKEIAAQQRVKLKFRDGREFITDHPHQWNGWDWSDMLHSPTDIVAYKEGDA